MNRKALLYARNWRLKNKDRLRFYWVWHAMKKRCDNPNFYQFKDYGGREIIYCKEWKDFKNFEADMKQDYKLGLTLDRIDVNGNYYKENCRWISRKEQNNNKRKHIMVNYKSKRMTLSQYAELIGMSFGTLRSRFYRGMPMEKIMAIKTLSRWNN
jgi:hypothetical protein